MFPTIFLRSLASNPFSPTNSRPVDEDSSNLEDQELWGETRVAHVLILGNGIASHWVSLWIFDDGDVWSVELSAADPKTGERLVKSRCSMKYLHWPPAHHDQHQSQVVRFSQNLNPLGSSFQKHKTSRPSREVEVIKDAFYIPLGREETCAEQVQKVVHQIWPLKKAYTRLYPEFFDEIFSADDPVNRLEEIMNSLSASDIRDLAEVLLLTLLEVAWYQGWSKEYRLAKISEEMDCLWLGSVPTEDEVNSVITSCFISWDVYMNGPRCCDSDFYIQIQEQCVRMDALWPMLLLFDQHLLNMIVRLLDELKEAQRKSWSPVKHFRIVRRAIYFLKGLFPHSWPQWYLIFQFFHGGIEWLRHFTTQRWSQLKTLPAQNLMDMTEHLLSFRFGMGEGSSCDELRPVHEEILAARAEFVFMKESILLLLEDAQCQDDRAKAIRRAKKPTWRTLPEKIICEQRRRVLKLFQKLLRHEISSVKRTQEELQKSMDILRPEVSSCKRRAEEILINYLEQYDYEILTWSIRVGETSPECLHREAERNPVVGTSYDVFFNNCQLYILHLLVKQYDLSDAHLHLPWNIGAIAAGPLLLIVEAFFIWVFEVIREEVHVPVEMAFLGFHMRLPAQLAATMYGFAWMALEINLTVSYLSKLLSKAASSNLVIGEILALVILLFVLWSFDIPPFTIPVVSFALDLLLVSLAGKVNIIDRDPLLFLLNVWMTLLSSSVICIVQLLYGWPMLLSLQCLLLFAFVIQRCFV